MFSRLDLGENLLFGFGPDLVSRPGIGLGSEVNRPSDLGETACGVKLCAGSAVGPASRFMLDLDIWA